LNEHLTSRPAPPPFFHCLVESNRSENNYLLFMTYFGICIFGMSKYFNKEGNKRRM
jgi:hypothetical protein